MSITMVFTLLTFMTLMAISANGLDNVGERCTISEGGGVTVDSCDGSRFLSCQSGRCACNDPVNQIYTFRLENEKRQRRGIGKKVAIGAGGAFVGYELAKATSGGSHSSSHDRESSSSKKKVYACFGRVGAPCALDYNNVNIVKLPNSTSTTEHPLNINHDNSSGTSTTSTTAAPAVFDLQKLSKCVHRAVCKPRNTGDNSTNIKTNDPRVGVCTCDIGYKRTATDICESGAFPVIPSTFTILATILLSINTL